MTVDDLPRFLTESEVAHMTGFPLGRLRNDRFERRGLPYVKFGRSVRYALEDVLKHLNSHKVVPESAA